MHICGLTLTMISSEAAAIEALQARGRFGIRLGLGRTRALLAALGSPQLDLHGPLIGGTNGKGSTQAMVSAVLAAAGLRVGQTPKPHLVSYRERIIVDGSPIAATDFGQLVSEVLAAADRLARRHGPPTEFEVLTCAALLWFVRSRVDIAVVEVGLGGRLDATNAWDGGVAVITNVALDHMEYLGDTVTAIAREKAAILKRGDLAVTGTDGEALAVVRRRSRRMDVPLRVTPPLRVLDMDRLGTTVVHPELGQLRLGLLGRHQAANAAVALGTLDALRDAGIADSSELAVRMGLAEVRWPGRLELLTVRVDPDGGNRAGPAGPWPEAGSVDVLLDGAHNTAGATALAAAVDDLRPHLAAGPVTLLLGILADKEVDRMVDALRAATSLRDASVITTRVPDTSRALDPTDLASAWGAGARAVAPVDTALEDALGQARSLGGPLVVCGSLYLVGHVRGRIVGQGLA
jgi:dihydrofolate synthase / folylpolyglutamate synthase